MAREKFVELSFLRQKLEGIAAEEACRRAKPFLLKKLDRLNAELLEAVEKKNVSNVLALNQQFHFAIYEASKYQILVPMIESLWLQAGPFMHFSMSAPGVQWNTSHHKDAIAAIAAGDAVASREAIENDIRRTADYLLENMAFES